MYDEDVLCIISMEFVTCAVSISCGSDMNTARRERRRAT